MNKLMIIILFLAFTSVVSAQELNLISVPTDQIQQVLSENNFEIPKSAHMLIKSNENINIVIGNTRSLNVVLENYKIISIKDGISEESTINVYATENAVKELENTKDPKKTLKSLLKSKELQIKPQSILGRVKVRIARVLLSFQR